MPEYMITNNDLTTLYNQKTMYGKSETRSFMTSSTQPSGISIPPPVTNYYSPDEKEKGNGPQQLINDKEAGKIHDIFRTQMSHMLKNTSLSTTLGD